MKLSIILPCYNEALALQPLLKRLQALNLDAEIIVVNDGSIDNSAEVAKKAGVRLVNHVYNKGNGAAIKSGIRTAKGDWLLFMDADGQHDPNDIKRLMEKQAEGYDMVVGARSSSSQASFARHIANGFYNHLASWMVEQKIEDLTSGLRLVNRRKCLDFVYLLPNGFSYPTTLTMSFFRAGYSVAYLPITAHTRIGKSHIKLFKDGLRFLLIIFKIGTLYSPLKLFGPLSAGFFSLGLSYYAYTYLSASRFTNMGMLLFTTAILIFLIGLISEQITNLVYKDSGQAPDE